MSVKLKSLFLSKHVRLGQKYVLKLVLCLFCGLFFFSGSELPALLLRDDKTAQRAVALRAAQVLCTQVCLNMYYQASPVWRS